MVLHDHDETVPSSMGFDGIEMTRRPFARGTIGTAASQASSDFPTVLLAIAAHDLRQPLQIIQRVYWHLNHQAKSDVLLLQLGQNAVDRLTEQLNELLGAVLLYEKTKQITLSPVRLHPLLQEACPDNEEIAARKQIGIRIVSTNASAMSDTLLRSAVLRNLVSNAIKYTEPGGRILLGCRRRGDSVRIDVFDTGIGISDDQKPRLFTAFSRLDSTQHDGLGIGPFIVRKAVGMLGHRIELSSVARRGSRFPIFAPRVDRTTEASKAICIDEESHV